MPKQCDFTTHPVSEETYRFGNEHWTFRSMCDCPSWQCCSESAVSMALGCKSRGWGWEEFAGIFRVSHIIDGHGVYPQPLTREVHYCCWLPRSFLLLPWYFISIASLLILEQDDNMQETLWRGSQAPSSISPTPKGGGKTFSLLPESLWIWRGRLLVLRVILGLVIGLLKSGFSPPPLGKRR